MRWRTNIATRARATQPGDSFPGPMALLPSGDRSSHGASTSRLTKRRMGAGEASADKPLDAGFSVAAAQVSLARHCIARRTCQPCTRHLQCCIRVNCAACVSSRSAARRRLRNRSRSARWTGRAGPAPASSRPHFDSRTEVLEDAARLFSAHSSSLHGSETSEARGSEHRPGLDSRCLPVLSLLPQRVRAQVYIAAVQGGESSRVVVGRGVCVRGIRAGP